MAGGHTRVHQPWRRTLKMSREVCGSCGSSRPTSCVIWSSARTHASTQRQRGPRTSRCAPCPPAPRCCPSRQAHGPGAFLGEGSAPGVSKPSPSPSPARTRLDQVQVLGHRHVPALLKARLAHGEEPLDHELHALVDVALVQHGSEPLKHAVATRSARPCPRQTTPSPGAQALGAWRAEAEEEVGKLTCAVPRAPPPAGRRPPPW